MRKILLGTGCDEAYYPKLASYLKSVEQHNLVTERFLVGVGWSPPSEHGFQGKHLPLHLALGDAQISCVQHGAFLHTLDEPDDTIIIFTDGDMLVQRSFTETERCAIEDLDGSTIMLGRGGFEPNRRLRHETHVLKPKNRGRHYKIPNTINLNLPVYNTGVVIATVEAYRKLYKRYMKEWQLIDSLFDYYSKQQWLISWIVGSDPTLRVAELSRAFHAHGDKNTGAVPTGCQFRKNVLYYHNEIVLFRHGV